MMIKPIRTLPIFFTSGAISLLVVILIGISFVFWASAAFGPSPDALAALQSTSDVNVITSPSWITFQPSNKTVNTGFIFYPDGKVEFRSYAPSLQQIAKAGYLVVLPNMPLNLALFDPDKASDVINAFPKVINWAVGGHALGGSMAAMFTADHQNEVKGLVLWAATPLGVDSLHNAKVKVLMVFGTLDGLVPQSKIDSARNLLPFDTLWVPIIGGDHAQFGSYGSQPGDNPALVSQFDQQMLAVKATVSFLDTLSK